MARKFLPIAALAPMLLALAAAAQPSRDATRPPAPDPATIDAIARLVDAQFYSKDVLRRVDWPAQVARAKQSWALAQTREAREAILDRLVASLRTSHTSYVPRGDPRFADIAAIFTPVLQRDDRRCPASMPIAFPVTRDGIGVWWRRDEGRWFVAGVLAGGAAERAGLRRGSEVVGADGEPFSPVAAFAGKAGRAVRLDIRREREGAIESIVVTPTREAPLAEFARAQRDGTRVITRDGRRIGYVPVWSGVGDDVVGALHDAVRSLNGGAGVDAFILDFRDGWGGAPAEMASIFDTRVPIVRSVLANGETMSFDGQIRKPTVVLINDGVRSGKETFVYAVKKHRLATLVGTPTAGAMLSGTVYCLPDGALLYLAVGTPTIDGEVREGRPVAPDVLAPFDVRWSTDDVPLDTAIGRLAR